MNDEIYSVTAEELQQFIEQVEQLEIEKKKPSDLIKEVFAEAKSRGYDVKTMRKIIRMRKISKLDLEEEEAILDVYKSALGMI